MSNVPLLVVPEPVSAEAIVMVNVVVVGANCTSYNLLSKSVLRNLFDLQ